MKKIAPSDGAKLALREESRCWDGTKPLLHRSAIVMGLVEEPLSTPATAEQESPKRGTVVPRAIRSQEHVKIVACRLRIAEVELHGLAFLNDISDRNGSGLLIRPDEVPNEEVTSVEMTPMLIDDDA